MAHLLLFRSSTPRALWVRSRVALAIGNQTRAAELYRRLARGKRDSPEAYFYASLAAQRLHGPSEAIAALEAGLQQFPDQPLLFGHYIRLCAELNDTGRLIRYLPTASADVRRACKQLFDQFPDPHFQSNLIEQSLRSGATHLVKPMLELLLQRSDDNVLLWGLVEVLLLHQLNDEAKLIYRRLAVRPAEDPLGLSHSALAEYRLGNLERALGILEAGIQRFPNTELIEHFAVICAQQRQMNRLIRFAVPDAKSERQACEALFKRFRSPEMQVALIDHCLNHGLEQLAEQKIEVIREGSDDISLLWQMSVLLWSRGQTEEANAIRRKLVQRAPKGPEDYFILGLALEALSRLDECLERLEQGLLYYPAAHELLSLYIRVCASRFEYDRYRDFLCSLKTTEPPTPVSMLDFYRTSMSTPVEFVINFADIELRMGERDTRVLRQDFHTYLRKNSQSISIAKVLTFYCRYLHLPDDFCLEVYSGLRIAFDGDNKVSWSLQILNEMTPPMIPRSAIQPDAEIRRFIEASRRMAEDALTLSEPIADMTNNWTPWQYIFCLGAPELYGIAMGAFENFVFNTWPKLNFTAEHLADAMDVRKQAGRKLRIGFIVHDSMPMMSGFLPGFNKQRFETVYLRPGKAGKSAAAQDWIARAGKVVQYSDVDTYAAIQTIADEELDIIVSGPSVAAVYYPMMARLAPLQMVLLEPNWTDGLTNADYYISWLPGEPHHFSDFYKTKVALFQHPPYWIEKPEVMQKGPISLEARAEIRNRLLNAGPKTRIYLCANTPPKISPDMDGIFQEILERDEDAILVLLRGDYAPTRTLKRRLRERLGPRFDRVVFVATMSKDDAHRLLQSVDCCLDSYPLCGMSSSFDGTMLGIPTVTLPADIPFGRWTAAIYEFMGATELIAKSREDYIDKALRLASDKEWRDQLSQELKEKSCRFVESEASSQELETFLLQAWDRKLQGLPSTNWIGGQWQ